MKMTVEIRIYDGCKYHKGSEEITRRTYDIEDYEVKEITDNEMYAEGFDEVDEYSEYLILTLKGGDIATFRNSHVDMFEAR